MVSKEKDGELSKVITSTRRTIYSTLWTYVDTVLREGLFLQDAAHGHHEDERLPSDIAHRCGLHRQINK